MPRDDGALRFTVHWEAGDFPAYALLNRQMSDYIAKTRSKGPGRRGALGVKLVSFFGVPLLSVAILAANWRGDMPDRAPHLVGVFIVVWLASLAMQRLTTWMSERAETDGLRRLFDETIVGMESEVIFNASGFSVRTDAFTGHFVWTDGPVRCRRWSNHLAVLHPRMPILLPTRAIDASVKDVFDQIATWAGAKSPTS